MKIIAGVDEVGRGSLIGPVYAAAVILNKNIDKKIYTIISKRKPRYILNLKRFFNDLFLSYHQFHKKVHVSFLL